jgi:hypothetical protein
MLGHGGRPRAHGFRFVIYTLDHEPAHDHIVGGGGQAKINLLGPGGRPGLVWSVGVKRSDLRRLFAEVVRRRDAFLKDWERIPMADLTEEQLRRAEARGRRMLEAEPRATAAHYDPAAGRVVIELANGCAYAFPAQRVQDLQGASEEDLANVEVDGAGFNLHWAKLDVDLYVPALVAGVFGTRAWIARELARVAGRVRSPAKAAAARSNGAKGGRPRKSAKAR